MSSASSTPAGQLAFEGYEVETIAGILALYVAFRMGPGTPADATLAGQTIQSYISEGAMVLKSFLVFTEAGNRLAVDDKGFVQGFPLPTGTPAAFSGGAAATKPAGS